MKKIIRPYQVEGVKHLLSMPFGKPHALLADEPGAGKTFQTTTATKEANCKNGIIICPAIIKEQWAEELVNDGVCYPDEIQVVYGVDAVLDSRPWKVVNYDLVREAQIREQFLKRNWHMLTMDEAHRLKTHTSQQTKSVFHRSYGIANKAYWKWSLSGTIVPNRPLELYPLLKTMCPEAIAPFDNHVDYIQRFCGGGASLGKGATNIPELTARIQPFMLRRTLKDVWKNCPDVIENDVWFDVPYESHPEWPALFEPTERRIIAESKIPQVVAYLANRLTDSQDAKLVCFSFHRSVVEGVARQLAKFNPAIIYGGFSLSKRLAEKAKFIQDPRCRLFLLQISSAGEGLDGLQHVTSECIEIEPEWSPGREDQAIRRVLRIGQTKPVILTRLFARDSYEEVILLSNLRKRKVIDVIQKPNGGNFCMSLEANIELIAHSAKRIADALEKLAAVPASTNLISAPAPQTVAPPQTAMGLPVAPGFPAAQAVPQQEVMPPQFAQQLVAQQNPMQFAPPIPGGPTVTAAGAAAMPVPGATAPIAPPPTVTAPAVSAPSQERLQFNAHVEGKLRPQGEQGMVKLQGLLGQFGIQRLNDLPENQFVNFLSFLG